MRAKQLAERLTEPHSKSLQPNQGALIAQDGENYHPQHPPLKETNAQTYPAVRHRLKKTNQFAFSGGRGCGLRDQRSDAVSGHIADVGVIARGLQERISSRP